MDKNLMVAIYCLFAGFAIVVMTFIILDYSSKPVSGSFDCDLQNIKLVNVSPHDCWSLDFSQEYCPIPENIHCSGSGQAPAYIFPG